MLSKFKNQKLLDDGWVTKTIDELMSGDLTNGSKLKKLSGFVENVYSIRGSIKARIVFTFGLYQGELSLFLLDILPNHDIPKNNTYDEQVRIVQKMTFGEGLPLEEPDAKAILSAITTTNPVPVYEFNRCGIILSEEQNKLIKAELPLLVNGPPGSGKTSTLFIILSELIARVDVGLHKRYLYIARSKALANFMREEWQRSGCKQRAEEHNITVEFKYAHCNFYQEVDEHFLYYPLVDKKRLYDAHNSNVNIPLTLGMTDTREWFDNQLKELKKRHKFDNSITIDFESFLQEKDILCGYSRDTYLANEFGKRNSLFDPSQKKIVYDLYEDYLKFVKNQMSNKQLFDLNLCKVNTSIGQEEENKYDIILVDETQDFSLSQLQDLKQLSCNNQLVMSIDTNQDLEKGLSLRTHIKGLFTCNGICSINSISLVKSFRCPEIVIELANCLIALKNKITGGVADKAEYSRFEQQSTAKEKGDALFVSSRSLHEAKELLSQFKDTEIVVVAHADKKEEAQKAFPNYTVFTPEEIKGLEYKCVITYQLFDTTLFKEANKELKKKSEKENVYRAKPGEARPLFAPSFNAGFTAFTRAQNALVIVQDNLNELSHITTPLKDIVDKANQKPVLVTNTNTTKQPIKTTLDDWKKQVNDLLDQGKHQKAEEVFNQRLKATLLFSFEEYKKKKASTQDISNTQSTRKESHPNKQEHKNPQNEKKATAQATRESEKKTQSLHSANDQKNTKPPIIKPNSQVTGTIQKKTQSLPTATNKYTKEQLIQKSSYLLNNFSELFLEIFLNHENLIVYRTLPLPQFNNQTFLDAIICDNNKKQIFEQLLSKKPLIFRKFFNQLELANMDTFAFMQNNLDGLLLNQYMKNFMSIFNQFNFPGFIVNHMVSPNCKTLLLQTIDGKSDKGLESLLQIKGVDVNKPDIFGFTPLLFAIGCNNINAVNILLKCEEIDVNKVGGDGFKPLCVAAGDDKSIDILKALLQFKGTVLDENLTPLSIAVKLNQKKAVKALLKVEGISVNYLDELLIFAKNNGSKEEIIELIELKRIQIIASSFSVQFFKYNAERKEIEPTHSHTYTSGNK